MTRDELKREYFNWMYSLVVRPDRSYYKLLRFLHGVDFQFSIPMDGNRAEDGMDLRYRFGYERYYDNPTIAAYLDDRPCSVLEMMIALAVRCEEHIMDDPDIGDRTSEWFWDMISNLGLENMSDGRFNEEYVEYVVDRFLERRYERNGKGGLFKVENRNCDMRSIDIWYQMCGYLEKVL